MRRPCGTRDAPAPGGAAEVADMSGVLSELKEVDLSAGAVYRYFSGKEGLIGAIVAEVLEVVGGTYERAALESPPPLPDVLIPRVLAQLREVRPGELDGGEWVFPRLMIQVWTESLRNDALSSLMSTGYDKVRVAWAKIVEGYKVAGLMPEEADADAMARTLIALATGFAAQMAVFGVVPTEVLRDGLGALMSMRAPEARP